MMSPAVKIVAALAALANVTPGLAQAGCGFEFSFARPDEGGTKTVKVFEGDPVASLGGVKPLLYLVDFKVNTDGTRISYHKDDPTGRKCQTDPAAGPCAINNIRNAYGDSSRPVSDFTAVRDQGFPLPKTWQILSRDIIEADKTTGKPCVTPDGYLVSMTADVAVAGGFNRVGDCGLDKWIDALTMPAIVLPKGNTEFAQKGAVKRSLVTVVSSSPAHRVVHGIVGDLGPRKEIGEANIAMNAALNGLAEGDIPKHRQDAIQRFQAKRSAVLVFPGADQVLGRPISGARIKAAGDSAFEKFGGKEKLLACIASEIEPGF